MFRFDSLLSSFWYFQGDQKGMVGWDGLISWMDSKSVIAASEQCHL